MCDIFKAKSEDVFAIKNLLSQLGYETEQDELQLAIALPQEQSDAFVAILGSEVIGFMSVIYFFYFPLQKKVCRITSIVINESHRGTGVGKQLIEFCELKAMENCCVQLEVTTSLLREKTQKYYEYLGFNRSSYRYYLDIDN